MSALIRTFAAALVISALLTQVCYAQEELPMSDRQKAEIARKKAEEKANDEAYKAMLKHTRDVKPPKADPWANVRPPPAGGGK